MQFCDFCTLVKVDTRENIAKVLNINVFFLFLPPETAPAVLSVCESIVIYTKARMLLFKIT